MLEAGVGVGQEDPAAMRTKVFGGDVSALLSPGGQNLCARLQQDSELWLYLVWLWKSCIW